MEPTKISQLLNAGFLYYATGFVVLVCLLVLQVELMARRARKRRERRVLVRLTGLWVRGQIRWGAMGPLSNAMPPATTPSESPKPVAFPNAHQQARRTARYNHFCRVIVRRGAHFLQTPAGRDIPGITNTVVSQDTDEARAGFCRVTVTVIARLDNTIQSDQAAPNSGQ